MLYALKQGATVIIDELDRSFHSLISEKFFDLFFEISKATASQFIATTHNLMLLDLKKFRKDRSGLSKKIVTAKAEYIPLKSLSPDLINDCAEHIWMVVSEQFLF